MHELLGAWRMLSPSVVIQPMSHAKGGLSEAGARLPQEIVAAAGARRLRVGSGRELAGTEGSALAAAAGDLYRNGPG